MTEAALTGVARGSSTAPLAMPRSPGLRAWNMAYVNQRFSNSSALRVTWTLTETQSAEPQAQRF